ncbi:hypothetical protein C4565_11005 [Candidatus Parcubacteria bacterium]|nr:MAG: hypothetical protein C4565_11005 [Candidatus Parcubacteria bacterium]
MKDQNSNKSMVVLSVEVVLMRKGGPQYHLVLARLERDYGCKIYDCFEHPEYLKSVLQDVYGSDYKTVVDSLEGELGEIVSEPDVAGFLKALRQNN